MIHTSAPATLMLMGEHAVLRNYPCLVAAASPRLHVYLKPRTDNEVHLKSSLGEYSCTLNNIEITPPFTFVLSLIKQFKKDLSQGFDLEIISEFAANLGLGSSAATLVATAAALLCHSRVGGNPLGSATWIPAYAGMTQEKIGMTPEEKNLFLFKTAKKSLLEVQGEASGADLSAALLGGIVYYSVHTPTFEKLPAEIPLVVIYSGSKMKTAEVIKKVNLAQQKHPEAYKNYFKEIAKAVELGKDALLQNDITEFADALILNQNIMEQMHLNNANIDHILKRLNLDSGILAAKISGSGLGDCVIALGELRQAKFPEGDFELHHGIKSIDLTLSPVGLIDHD